MEMSPREIELAYDGYRRTMDEKWEMTRTVAFWSALGGGHMKKDFNPSKVWIPPDENKKVKKIEGKATPDMFVKFYKDGKIIH